jgi:hypothetical protein
MSGGRQGKPRKTCVTCGREFEWRKKWERDWERVVHCSERCARGPERAAGQALVAGTRAHFCRIPR